MLGIVPQINSAFRTFGDQERMRNGASGKNPAAMFSWHSAGAAVDLNGTASKQFRTIISIMKKNGSVWGGDFTKKDPPHFDGRGFVRDQFIRIMEHRPHGSRHSREGTGKRRNGEIR